MSNLNHFTPSVEQAQQVAEQIKTRFPKVAALSGSRLQSAALLAATPGAVSGSELEGYQVRSQTKPAEAYKVNLSRHSCTCPDHIAHGQAGIICKHRIAAAIVKQLEPQAAARRLPQVGDMGQVHHNRETVTVEVTHVVCAESGEPTWFTLKVLSTDRNGNRIPFFNSASGLGMQSVMTVRADELYSRHFFTAE